MPTAHRVLAVAAVVSIGIGVTSGCTSEHGTSGAMSRPASSASAAPTSSAVLTQRDLLRHYVETDPAWIQGALLGGSFGGRFFCGLSVMGADASPSRVYIWAYCKEFYNKGGVAAPGSASSIPAVLQISGSGSATKVSGFAVPGSGSLYDPDVRRLFPPRLLTVIFAGRQVVDQTDTQLQARAEKALQAGELPSPSTG